MTKLAPVVLLHLLVLANSELICYDCDPTSPGKCISPSQDNAKMTNCHAWNQNEGISIPTTSPECFTLQYQINNRSRDGIYRGCTLKVNKPTCDYLNETLYSKVTWCRTCSESRCNL